MTAVLLSHRTRGLCMINWFVSSVLIGMKMNDVAPVMYVSVRNMFPDI